MFQVHPAINLNTFRNHLTGVDLIKSGYGVAPGSRHLSGNYYAWAEEYSPFDQEIAEVPSFLLEAFGAKPLVEVAKPLVTRFTPDFLRICLLARMSANQPAMQAGLCCDYVNAGAEIPLGNSSGSVADLFFASATLFGCIWFFSLPLKRPSPSARSPLQVSS